MSRDTDDGLFGYADLHNHQFANLAFGGRVVYGRASGDPASTFASCTRLHGPHGLLDITGALSEMVLAGRGPSALLGHRTRGYPELSAWPRWDDFTHQAVRQEWLERAVYGGLRLMVMMAVHNRLLCRLTGGPCQGACDTAAAVEAQLAAAELMQARVDRECGGRNRGWYRVVDEPAQALEVIASGRLAVVLGVEVDDLFDFAADPEPTDDELVRAVDRYHSMGVRHVLPIHFADNCLGGAAFAILSWAKKCGVFSRANPWNSLPVYRMTTTDGSAEGYRYRDGRVNGLGLTRTGRRLITLLLSRGIIVDVDHMSARSRADTLSIAERVGRPVVAGHVEFRDLSVGPKRGERQLTGDEVARVVRLGGMVAPILRQPTVEDADHAHGPYADTVHGFRSAYLYAVRHSPAGAVGLGTDLNGFAGGVRPFSPGGEDERDGLVRYPFRTLVPDGRTLDRARTGLRTFDVNTDGLPHIGMLPDLLAQLQATGLDAEQLRPLTSSAKGYVDVWQSVMGR